MYILPVSLLFLFISTHSKHSKRVADNSPRKIAGWVGTYLQPRTGLRVGQPQGQVRMSRQGRHIRRAGIRYGERGEEARFWVRGWGDLITYQRHCPRGDRDPCLADTPVLLFACALGLCISSVFPAEHAGVITIPLVLRFPHISSLAAPCQAQLHTDDAP